MEHGTMSWNMEHMEHMEHMVEQCHILISDLEYDSNNALALF